MKKNCFLRGAAVLSAALLCLLFAACSAQNGAADNELIAPTTSYSNGGKGETGGAGETPQEKQEVTEQTVAEGRKIIRNLSCEMETLDFDASMNGLESLCTELGGYVQESRRSGTVDSGFLRSAYYVMRIPQEKLSQWQARAGEAATVLSEESSTEDVTDSYFDAEARLKSLQTKRERLLSLLEKADSLSDVLSLEQELSTTNYEIEKLTGTLKKYDSLVGYSTVTVSLREVTRPTEKTEASASLGGRMAKSFQQSLRALGDFGSALIVWLAGNILVLILLAAIVVLVVVLVRRYRKRRAAAFFPQSAPVKQGDAAEEKEEQ